MEFLSHRINVDLSLIIVNHNTRGLLKQLLLSIKRNTKKVFYEIIVVDNASGDRSAALVKEDFQDIVLIENQSNLGFSQANNQAVKIAKGDYLLFLNSDTIVCENAVESLFSFLEQEKYAAVVGCKLLNIDDTLQRSCGIFPNLKTEFYFRTFLNRLFPTSPTFGSFKLGSWDYSSLMEVDWVSGACLMIRKNIFDQIGGFDETLYMYYEDADLCLRVKKLGWKIYFIPDAYVYHLHGGSWQQNREIPIINGCKSALYFFRKHHDLWKVPLLKILILIETLLSYLILTPILVIKGEKYAIIKSRFRGYTACLKYLLSDSFGKSG
ncbi:MAG: glycosyltransferase family 2 protein [bacterium]